MVPGVCDQCFGGTWGFNDFFGWAFFHFRWFFSVSVSFFLSLLLSVEYLPVWDIETGLWPTVVAVGGGLPSTPVTREGCYF